MPIDSAQCIWITWLDELVTHTSKINKEEKLTIFFQANWLSENGKQVVRFVVHSWLGVNNVPSVIPQAGSREDRVYSEGNKQ